MSPDKICQLPGPNLEIRLIEDPIRKPSKESGGAFRFPTLFPRALSRAAFGAN